MNTKLRKHLNTNLKIVFSISMFYCTGILVEIIVAGNPFPQSLPIITPVSRLKKTNMPPRVEDSDGGIDKGLINLWWW